MSAWVRGPRGSWYLSSAGLKARPTRHQRPEGPPYAGVIDGPERPTLRRVIDGAERPALRAIVGALKVRHTGFEERQHNSPVRKLLVLTLAALAMTTTAIAHHSIS